MTPSLVANACITFVAWSWSLTLHRGEKVVDRDRDRMPAHRRRLRFGLSALAALFGTLSAACIAVGAWSAVGFVLAALETFR